MSIAPATATELQQIVRDSRRVRVRGGATKCDLQREAPDSIVDLRGLSGIVEYSPDECVVTARAGTSLRDIQAALDVHRQYLPFDPPFADDGATIGGTVAAGVSGPGRYRYGGVRDFLIGVRLVDGEGRVIQSGGKVVKNAAGFLLHHGVVGSGGRFGVLADVTFKIFPAPEARQSVTVQCDGAGAAFAAARRVEQLRWDCESIEFDERGTLCVTLAGRLSAIDARLARLADALGTVSAPGRSRPTWNPSPKAGTDPESLLTVAGVMDHWQTLRQHVRSAHFMCAGAVAWLATADLPSLAHVLAEAKLAGRVIRGPHAGERVGHVVTNEFEERVRRVLDPHGRFSAAPNSRH